MHRVRLLGGLAGVFTRQYRLGELSSVLTQSLKVRAAKTVVGEAFNKFPSELCS